MSRSSSEHMSCIWNAAVKTARLSRIGWQLRPHWSAKLHTHRKRVQPEPRPGAGSPPSAARRPRTGLPLYQLLGSVENEGHKRSGGQTTVGCSVYFRLAFRLNGGAAGVRLLSTASIIGHLSQQNCATEHHHRALWTACDPGWAGREKRGGAVTGISRETTHSGSPASCCCLLVPRVRGSGQTRATGRRFERGCRPSPASAGLRQERTYCGADRKPAGVALMTTRFSLLSSNDWVESHCFCVLRNPKKSSGELNGATCVSCRRRSV